jgi:HK97 family phage prohead protease
LAAGSRQLAATTNNEQRTMEKAFVLNDENKTNSYGFRVKNDGGKFERFKANPVMLYNHKHDDVTGKWDNLKIEGALLLAEPVFDDDENATKIQKKVEKGFLKGVSMGLQILKAEMGADGVPVVTEWELQEASIVSVPSNANSLRLYNQKGELMATEEIKLSINEILNINNQTQTKMDVIKLTAEAAKALDVAKEVDITTLNAAVMELVAAKELLQTQKEKAETELKTYLTNQATALVDAAIKEGRLTADKKASFVKLAEADFTQAKDIIDAIPAKRSFSAGIKTIGTYDDKETFAELQKGNPKKLAELKANDPERFKELYKKQFGVEPKI